MKKLIISLLNKWMCMHDWKLLSERDVVGFERSYTSFTYCCNKCGKFKKIKSS